MIQKPDGNAKTGRIFEGMEQCGFTDIAIKLYYASRTYGADEYIMFLETMSDHRSMPEEIKTALYAGIKEVIFKHAGQLKMDFVFQLYMGESNEKQSGCRSPLRPQPMSGAGNEFRLPHAGVARAPRSARR